jgi:hypothetical protein
VIGGLSRRVVAVLSLMALCPPVSARVIGHSESAEPLSKERVMRASLPQRRGSSGLHIWMRRKRRCVLIGRRWRRNARG